MFSETFDAISQKMPEIQMIGIWGKDGLELEKKIFKSLNIELELLGAEIADVVSRIDQIRVNTQNFRVEIKTRSVKLAIFSLNHEYFIFLVGDDSLLFGRCKFYIDLFLDNLKSKF